MLSAWEKRGTHSPWRYVLIVELRQTRGTFLSLDTQLLAQLAFYRQQTLWKGIELPLEMARVIKILILNSRGSTQVWFPSGGHR